MSVVNDAVPTIDLAAAHDGEQKRAALVAAIDDACRGTGFFALTGHDIDAPLRLEMLDAARAFFALPDEAKRSIAIEQSQNHCGYATFGGERLQPDLLGDAKETLDFGIERSADDPGCSPLEGPNQWPNISGFRATVERYQSAALQTADTVLGLIAEALELPTDFFREWFVHPLAGTRMVHYPPVSEQELDVQLGCGAHSDYGCITLLATDGTPGLQLLRRDDTWVDVQVPDDALIVNIGDLLGRWTNDRYRSTQHRVLSPTDRHRFAVPVFIDPAYDTPVECLASCTSPEDPPRYAPITAGAFIQSRFDDTFAYRATED